MNRIFWIFTVLSIGAWPVMGQSPTKALVARSMENDAQALEAISEFYSAVSQLQRIDFEDLDLSNSEAVRKPQLARLSAAKEHFTLARQHLITAISDSTDLIKALPNKRAPIQKGLDLLAPFKGALDQIINDLDSHTLPETALIHRALFAAQDYAIYGKKRSQKNEKSNGPKFKF